MLSFIMLVIISNSDSVHPSAPIVPPFSSPVHALCPDSGLRSTSNGLVVSSCLNTVFP